MPPLNSRWRLLNDWALPNDLRDDYCNRDMFGTGTRDWQKAHNLVGQYPTDWLDRYLAWVATKDHIIVPAGTVFQFNRYHASNSGGVQITLQFIVSPDPALTPRKRGGKGRGFMRLYLQLENFNSLGEMEDASDVTD